MALVDSAAANLLLRSEMDEESERSDSDDCSTDGEDDADCSNVKSPTKRKRKNANMFLGTESKTEKEELGYHKMFNIESRNYQTELLKLALKDNIIICLPTGTGKTYIALKLTEAMLADAIEKKQKIIFVANNVPLVHQQAKYFSANLVSTAIQDDKYVRAISGDLNTDIWKEEQWNAVMAECHILVMSTQILLDAITKAYVKWNQIALLILDECHHARKNHPMANLMKHYGERKAHGASDLPKVLGLTATIIAGQSKIDQIPKDIEDIEKLLCCKAVTHRNYEEVLKHSTDSNMTPIIYTMNYSREDPVCMEVNNFIEFLTRLPKTFVSDEEMSLIEKVKHPSLTSEDQIYSKDKGVPRTLKSFLVDLLKTYEELGPYCCKLAATLKLYFICQWIRQLDDESFCSSEMDNDFQVFKMKILVLLYSAQTLLVQFSKKLEGQLAEATKDCSEANKETFMLKHCVSNKIKRVWEILEKKREAKDDADKLCGLLFCERRITAQVLRYYFDNVAKRCPELSFVKPELMVGHSTIVQNTDVARFTAKKQTKILQRFHAKELNLLVATQVVEEGLNVPSCNLVIRFDTIQTYPSFVQSMGRARKKGAQCYALIEASIQQKEQHKIYNYVDYNRKLAAELEQNAIHIGDGNEDRPDNEYDVAIPPFCPSNDPDGPVITASDAISIVHRYCNALSCDKIAALNPTAFWEDMRVPGGKPQFKAYVILPILSPVREVVEGELMSDKTLAKKSAYLEVCKKLYYKNELNKYLLPRPRSIDNYKCEFLSTLALLHDVEKRSTKAKVGTRKRVQHYTKEIPKTLVGSNVVPDKNLFVYKIGIEMKEFTREIDFKQLYDFKRYSMTYGIVTQANLDNLPSFELLDYYGTFNVTISRTKISGEDCVCLTQEQFIALQSFQKFLCESVYRIKNPVLVNSPTLAVLIAPLSILDRDGQNDTDCQIDWDLVSTLNNCDELALMQKPDEEQLEEMSFDPKRFENAILVPWYKENKEPELLCTLNILHGTNARTEFDEPQKFPTFEVYYKNKYEVDLHHPEFPLIRCKAITSKLNFLNPKLDGKSLRKEMKKSILKLVPELNSVHDLPASMYIQGKLLPSIMHKVGRLLLAKELRVAVASYFNWNVGNNSEVKELTRQNKSEIVARTASTSVRLVETKIQQLSFQIGNNCNHQRTLTKVTETESYFFVEDMNPMEIPWAALSSAKTISPMSSRNLRKSNGRDSKYALPEPPVRKSFGRDLLAPIDSICFTSFDKLTDFKIEKGPSIQTIVEALTLSNAQDSVDLEKLEVMGDSVLKVLVSLHIFRCFPQWDEGKMTLLRTKLISNLHLYQIGKEHNLGRKLAGGIFIPNVNWLPCGFSVPLEIEKFILSQPNVNYEVFKAIPAEVLAAASNEHEYKELIWAVGGVSNAAKQITHTTLTHSKLGDKSIADAVEAIIGAYYVNGGLDSAFRVMEFLGLRGPMEDGSSVCYSRETTLTPEKNEFPYKNQRYQNIVPLLKDLEEILDYKFKNPWLAVEALTHPTYMGNRITPCYERLEFVGDAILDFLVTNYIFRNTNITDPGEITDLRSALVNNVTFASLSVRYGFHTFLKYDSEILTSHIVRFAQFQEENNYEVGDPYELLSDFDCAMVREIEVPKVLGDVFESLAGAVFVDSGMSIDTIWKVFYRLMKTELELFSQSIPKSPVRKLYEQFPKQVKFKKLTGGSNKDKDRPQELCAAKFQAVSLKVPGISEPILGVGSTIKQAKQAAAKYVIRCLKKK